MKLVKIYKTKRSLYKKLKKKLLNYIHNTDDLVFILAGVGVLAVLLIKSILS